MTSKTIAELSRDLESKAISSVELTEDCLKRIEKSNPSLNCFLPLHLN